MTRGLEPVEHALGCGCPVHDVNYEPPDTGPIVVMRQPIEPFITAELDALPPDVLPSLHLTGPVSSLRAQLARGLAECQFEPQWLANWLVENVAFQARLFTELTKAPRLRLRLERVDDDSCRRFHTDNLRSRLVCTYRGPGTEYIDPRTTKSAAAGTPINPASILQLERGAVALMRGGREATPERPGVVHRSPRIEGTGLVRLFLAIEAQED